MNKYIQIAIDGPTASGKSTISSSIADELEIIHIDTGAMYRALALKVLLLGIDYKNEKEIEKLLENIYIDFKDDGIYLDGKNVNKEIRKNEISLLASHISAYPKVRLFLTNQQRKIANQKSVIMDGRDIGTNVLHNANYKFFLVARPEIRGLRRFKELKNRDEEISLEKIIEEINFRDYNDTTRKFNPLRKAEDAIEIDTSEMTIEEVKNFILSRIVEINDFI